MYKCIQFSHKLCCFMHKLFEIQIMKLNKPTTNYLTIATECGKQIDLATE